MCSCVARLRVPCSYFPTTFGRLPSELGAVRREPETSLSVVIPFSSVDAVRVATQVTEDQNGIAVSSTVEQQTRNAASAAGKHLVIRESERLEDFREGFHQARDAFDSTQRPQLFRDAKGRVSCSARDGVSRLFAEIRVDFCFVGGKQQQKH